MALCHITGTVYLPDGSVAARREVHFYKIPDTITADYLGAVAPEPVVTRTDNDGAIDVNLITGNYHGYTLDRNGKNRYLFKAVVPELANADFADLIAAVDPVEPLPSWLQQVLQARDEAEAAADRIDLGALDDAVAQTGIDRAAAEIAASTAAADANAQIAPNVAAAQAAADASIQAGQWDQDVADAAARLALTGLAVNWQVYQRDTEHVWRWDGSAWVDRGVSPLALKADKTALAAEANARVTAQQSGDIWPVEITGGTANALIGTSGLGRAIGRRFQFTPMETNTGSVTLTLNGTSLSLRDYYDNSITAGTLRPGVPHIIVVTTTTRAMLVSPAVSRYAGNPVAADLNSIVSGDLHVLSGGFTNGPSDYPDSTGLLSLEVNGAFIRQTLTRTSSSTTRWERINRPSSGTYGNWAEFHATGGPIDPNLPFAGKRIAWLGDSITENYDWPEALSAALGATAVKGAFGGTRLTEMTDSLAGMCGVDVADAISSGDWVPMEAAAEARWIAVPGDDNRPIVAALKAVDWATVDYVVCFWGTNDWGNNVPLGTTGDENRTTIRGGVNYVMERILGAYPHLGVLWVGPMFRARRAVGDGNDSDTTPNNTGVYLRDLADAILSEAQDRWNGPVYDLYRNSGINKSNYVPFLRDQTVDGLHPGGPLGRPRLMERLGAALLSAFRPVP